MWGTAGTDRRTFRPRSAAKNLESWNGRRGKEKGMKTVFDVAQEGLAPSVLIRGSSLPPDEAETRQAPLLPVEDAVSAAVEAAEGGPSSRTACATCALAFESVLAQREHFRSDFHRLNLRRKSLGMTAVLEEQAEEALAALEDAEDEDSLSGSGSESEGEVEGNTDSVAFHKEVNSMWIGVPVHRKEDSEKEIAWMLKSVVLDRNKENLDMKILVEKDLWVILMHGAGHFAGVVMNNRGSVIAQKSFHRYVIRAKQGKAQSRNDNASGMARSAGAHIRRYNEQMLRTEIRELLSRWISFISDSSRIFVAISKRDQGIFFFDDKILSSKDPRVRRIPFATRRPTVKEAGSVGRRLTVVQFELESEFRKRQEEERRKQETEKELRQNNVIFVPVVKPEKEEDEDAATAIEDSAELKALLEACRNGSIDEVQQMLVKMPDLLNAPSQEGEEGGCTLHIAAKYGHAKLIWFLLEQGASPSMPDLHGKVPYQCAENKKERDTFRKFMGEFPDRFDYGKTAIPSPITDETETLKKEKQKQKKKRQTENRKISKEKERRRQEAEAKRRADEEAAMLAAAESCASCEKKLIGDSSKWFNRLDYFYCSTDCMQAHRRGLQREAAIKRLQGS